MITKQSISINQLTKLTKQQAKMKLFLYMSSKIVN